MGEPPALLEAVMYQLPVPEPAVLHPAGIPVPSNDSEKITARFCAIVAVAKSNAKEKSKVFFIVMIFLRWFLNVSGAKI